MHIGKDEGGYNGRGSPIAMKVAMQIYTLWQLKKQASPTHGASEVWTLEFERLFAFNDSRKLIKKISSSIQEMALEIIAIQVFKHI